MLHWFSVVDGFILSAVKGGSQLDIQLCAIRDEYQGKSRTKRKTELKIHLAEKWAVSLSTVEKIITEGNDLFP